ncbi:unnamed protein product, partial [Chrysoparadoxa australica]
GGSGTIGPRGSLSCVLIYRELGAKVSSKSQQQEATTSSPKASTGHQQGKSSEEMGAAAAAAAPMKKSGFLGKVGKRLSLAFGRPSTQQHQSVGEAVGADQAHTPKQEKTKSPTDPIDTNRAGGAGGSDARAHKPGPLRVRVLIGSDNKRDMLRRGAEAWLAAIQNGNAIKRNALVSFALQELSQALSVWEVLSALPAHVQELTIIQQPCGLINMVPVHALPLMEHERGKERRESSSNPDSCVLDRFSVRYATSVYMLELCERQAAASLRETPWYLNGCCIVEDPLREVELEGRHAVAGPKGRDAPLSRSNLECSVVSSSWSPGSEGLQQCRSLISDDASREHFTTVVAAKKKAKKDPYKSVGLGLSSLLGKAAEAPNSKQDGKTFAANLKQARCLHLCCHAVHHPKPSITLCSSKEKRREVKAKTKRLDGTSEVYDIGDDGKRIVRKRSSEGPKDLIIKRRAADDLDAPDLLSQLHLRHCGLVVLSRGGLLNDLESLQDIEASASSGDRTPLLGLVDTFLAAGAHSVVSKLWYDDHVVLADIVIMMRFYQQLRETTMLGEKRPVAVSLREAQLFLKNATLKDIFILIQDAQGLGQQDQEDMTRVLSNLFRDVSSRSNVSAQDKPFSNPFYWASFIASGACTAVHSRQSVEADDIEDATAKDERSLSSSSSSSSSSGSSSSSSSSSS